MPRVCTEPYSATTQVQARSLVMAAVICGLPAWRCSRRISGWGNRVGFTPHSAPARWLKAESARSRPQPSPSPAVMLHRYPDSHTTKFLCLPHLALVCHPIGKAHTP
jgi:hypothetical protein